MVSVAPSRLESAHPAKFIGEIHWPLCKLANDHQMNNISAYLERRRQHWLASARSE